MKANKGFNKRLWDGLEQPVVAKVTEIMNSLTPSASGRGGADKTYLKFEDADFGPNEKSDPDGKFAFYRSGKAPKGYADPRSCRWARPCYAPTPAADGGGGDDDVDAGENEKYDEGPKPFCENGFLGMNKGSTDASDVKQGKLGDCWLLGAVAVVAGRDDLLKKIFWKCEDQVWEQKFRRHGMRVCRFQKDCDWFYVIIDDRVPVYDSSNKPVFASSPDKNELWVPLLEKAYAKLHGSYDATIGGYIDGGVKDLTGCVSENLVLREGHIGFHPSNAEDLEKTFPDPRHGEMPRLLKKMDDYLNVWGCMMGCSIQPDPGSKHGGVEHKVLNDDGTETGLLMKHAYSLIDVGQVWVGKKAARAKNKDMLVPPKGAHGRVWLMRLRNPWGFGEWTGKYSDEWLKKPENKDIAAEIKHEFSGPIRRVGQGQSLSPRPGDEDVQEVTDDANDGTFFISWEDWKKHFTVIFAGVDFPGEWTGMRIHGEWNEKTAGGSVLHDTWGLNPRYRFEIDHDQTRVFISLSQDDPRLTHGRDYNRILDPIAFHILKIDDAHNQLLEAPATDAFVEGSNPEEKQATYKFHHSNDLDITLDKGEYVLVPSCFDPFKYGKFFISLFSNKPFHMEGAHLIVEEVEEGENLSRFHVGKDQWQSTPRAMSARERKTAVEFELAAAKLLRARRKHRIKMSACRRVFDGDADGLDKQEFVDKLMGIGFMKSELQDFEIFSGGDEYISQAEFANIFETETKKRALFGIAPGGSAKRGRGDQSAPGMAAGGDEAAAPDAGAPGTDMLQKLLRASVEGGSESIGEAVQRLTKENMLLKVELAQCKVEMQNMMHILLLYGRMLGCYEGPVPTAEALPKLVPDALPAMPKGTFGAAGAAGGADDWGTIAAAAGDEALAVKPWLGAIKATTPATASERENNPGPPASKLELAWVYGYQAQASRNNLRYNNSHQGGFVYPAAGLGVIYDQSGPKGGTQTYVRAHDDDVTCLAVSSDRSFAVSGQMGKKPRAVVWNTDTGKVIGTLGGVHKRAVGCVAVHPDGNHIAMVGEDDNHSVSLWHRGKEGWNKKDGGSQINNKGNKAKTLFIAFTGDKKWGLCTGGVKFVSFWEWAPGTKKLVKPKAGVAGKGGNKNQPIICGIGVNGTVYTGASDGNIFSWSANSRAITKVTKAHEKACDAIAYNGTDGLVSGGKDGKVCLWNMADMTKLAALDMNGKKVPRAIKPLCPFVRSVDWNKEKNLVLVGTMGSEIYEINGLGVDKDPGVKRHMAGHYKDELWAVAAHPKNASLAASAGDDGTVRLWNLDTHSMERMFDGGKKNMYRALDFNKDGSKIAVGCGGRLGGTRGKKSKKGAMILNVADMSDIKGSCVAKKWVQVVRYSPDGSTLAVGSHDNKTYLYKTPVGKGQKPTAVCKKNSSFLMNIDWSKDSKSIQVTDGAHELLFYKNSGQQITKGGIMHDKLATFTCELGWPVQGIWPPSADGTDINRCARSPDNSLIATADDFGQVKLFNYPCVKEGAEFNPGRGHASHVAGVVFSKDGKTLLTAGGNDRCIMQWNVVPDNK